MLTTAVTPTCQTPDTVTVAFAVTKHSMNQGETSGQTTARFIKWPMSSVGADIHNSTTLHPH